jgi:ribonuclease P protein component
MLPKINRLSSREDFATVYSRGRFGAENGITIKYLLADGPRPKLGFSIGKKYSPKAVVRNRTRRILRAACFPLLTQLKPGIQVVIMIRPEYRDLNFWDAQQKLTMLFSKTNLFK